jgi:S-methylmethionine-dependent homocysteine/selenocysteine methylase
MGSEIAGVTAYAPALMVTILDGGMSRELLRLGAPFRQPEWSALALMESPDHVRRAHAEFARAGATVLTTNAYAVVPFHLGQDRFVADGHRLATLAGELCRVVADEFGARVAGCLPPPLGSYRPDAFEPGRAREVLEVLVAAQAPYVDLWLAETMSSVAEAELAASVVEASGSSASLWISFTVDDHDGTRLRSGEPVADAVRAAEVHGADAVLFNCSRAEVMADAVRAALEGCSLPVGVYPNLFDEVSDDDANEILHDVRADASAAAYARWAERWIEAGATIVGGCCGADARHIAALSAHLAAR